MLPRCWKKHTRRYVSPGTYPNLRSVLTISTNYQCPDTPFVLSQLGLDAVILPTSEIETVKSLPETELSIKYEPPESAVALL
jgi:hypothetical protein